MFTKDECKCPIRPGMTFDELMEEIVVPELHCTSLKMTNGAKGWICPNLDKELERARKERRQKQYSSKATRQRKVEKAKQLKRQGLSDEEIVIELKSQKTKRKRPSVRKIKSSKTNFESF